MPTKNSADTSTEIARKLGQIINQCPNRLLSLTDERASVKPASGKWSPKEELGHLIDSASNNHQRIVRAQLETLPRMPGYDGDAWVAVHAYQQREWSELVSLWTSLNRQLFRTVSNISDAASLRACTIADSGPLTIRFIFEDYLVHMLHHLGHMGIQVDDFRKPSRNGDSH